MRRAAEFQYPQPIIDGVCPRLRITSVECHVLLAPDFDVTLTSSAQDSFIVFVHTDGGITGIGETDANPWMVKACIDARGTHTMGLGLAEMLIGRDPFDIRAIAARLYRGSAMNGRRGVVVHAIGALEMALWDLCGKAVGKPVHALLGGCVRDEIVPYASLQPDGRCYEQYRDALIAAAERARALGFRAMKAEITMAGPYAHGGMHESFDRHTQLLAAVRKAVGPATTLMVDVQYMWDDAATCLSVVRDWKEFDLFFLETPIWADSLDEYARLVAEAPMPIAAGEWLATRYEFQQLMDEGAVQVAQPDVGRVGGLGEAKIVCDMAAERGRMIVPHCWKTGISISATAHLAFGTSHCPYIEYLPPELCIERLRRELAQEDSRLVDGRIRTPTLPGLGVTVDMKVVERFTVA